jgi:triacylglycerol lipase
MLKPTYIFLSLVLISSFQLAFATPDFSVIKAQAKLSDDTYLAADTMTALLKDQGQTLVHQATFINSQVSYLLSEKDGVQTIAIRGTANLENVMLNLNVSLLPDAKLDIMLHQGFASAAKAVYKDVKPYLVAGKPIQTTGHSLGGAIAVIVAMYLKMDDYPLTNVVTFGQPKVTNVSGAERFAGLPLTRIVTLQDIVPLVPPLSPLQIKDLDIYWHMGEEVILMGNNKFAVTNGLKSMLRATKFTSAIPSEQNLTAHKMTTYLGLVNALQEKAIEEPYKMQINVFGFSLE